MFSSEGESNMSFVQQSGRSKWNEEGQTRSNEHCWEQPTSLSLFKGHEGPSSLNSHSCQNLFTWKKRKQGYQASKKQDKVADRSSQAHVLVNKISRFRWGFYIRNNVGWRLMASSWPLFLLSYFFSPGSWSPRGRHSLQLLQMWTLAAIWEGLPWSSTFITRGWSSSYGVH